MYPVASDPQPGFQRCWWQRVSRGCCWVSYSPHTSGKQLLQGKLCTLSMLCASLPKHWAAQIQVIASSWHTERSGPVHILMAAQVRHVPGRIWPTARFSAVLVAKSKSGSLLGVIFAPHKWEVAPAGQTLHPLHALCWCILAVIGSNGWLLFLGLSWIIVRLKRLVIPV